MFNIFNKNDEHEERICVLENRIDELLLKNRGLKECYDILEVQYNKISEENLKIKEKYCDLLNKFYNIKY